MSKHRFVIDGQRFEVEVMSRSGEHVDVSVNGERMRVVRELEPEGGAAAGVPIAAPPRPRKHGATASEVRAPMAGRVLRVCVARGQRVDLGAEVVVLDAMKMENSIASTIRGVVSEVGVREGDTVLQGAWLLRVRGED